MRVSRTFRIAEGMQRRTVVLLLTVTAFLGGLWTGRDLLFNLTYLLGLLLIVSFAWSWINLNYVHISRLTRTRRTQVGRPLEERFAIRNTSVLPKLWLEVRDFSSLPVHYASHVINNLGGKKQYSWRVTTLCRERGRYQLGPMRLATSDPFGLFPLQKDLTPTSNVVVYPLTFDIQQFSLPIGLLPGGDALRRRTHYVTTNASSVRDYAPGDSFSRIHWKSSARRSRLIVKEFELDPLADIWVVPDMSIYGHVAAKTIQSEALTEGDLPKWMSKNEPDEFELPEATEEYMVSITASLAQYFLRRDRSVGMLAYGQSNEILQPDRGERQINRVLETLSVLRAKGSVPLPDMLNAEAHLFPRGTTVIVVTPTTSENWPTAAQQLSRRGLRIVSVMIDPESFGGVHSAAPIYTLLRASGLGAYLVNNGDDLSAVLSMGNMRAGQSFVV